MWGAPGSNVCPAGSYVIVDSSQCQAAAAGQGWSWHGMSDGSMSDAPRGCYGYLGGSSVKLNTHATGGLGYNYYQPLCAVAAGVRIISYQCGTLVCGTYIYI